MSNADMSAFPVNVTVHPEWNQEWQNGLTKREYFAAKALQGLLAATDEKEEFKSLSDYAAAAVSAADVLIEALNKPVQS